MIPRQRLGQPFDVHQQDMANWLGCTVEQMNRDHDELHEELCGAFGVESQALRKARGEPHDAHIATLEEQAVLHVQRWLCAVRYPVSTFAKDRGHDEEDR